jgi:hypothetical protein
MLSVVEKEQEAKKPSLDDYEPLLLATQELLDRYWPQAAVHLERVVNEAMHGELTVEDIYQATLEGRMYVMVAKNDDFELPDVKFVLVLEVRQYPRYAAMNVVAIAGSDLRHLMKRFWGKICSWAYINGVRKFECSVAPAMERILSSAGFERHYVQMRQDLTEAQP